jgi:hypothetical protein
MATRFGNWLRKRVERHESSAHGPDMPAAPARNWALGLMIVASAGALLATSDDKHPIYKFETSSDGPRATLSASEPQARYLVRARVTALGPKGIDSTNSAAAIVHGTISASASAIGDGARPLLLVRLSSAGLAGDAVSVLGSFQLSRAMRFTGDCAKPTEGTPCQAEFELHLELAQPSTVPADGSLSIAWSVDFEARTFKPKGESMNDEELAAPWTIEIVQQ